LRNHFLERAKMVHSMEVKKNKFIEQWAAYRENSEYLYKWTPRRVIGIGLLVGVIPYYLYRYIVYSVENQYPNYGAAEYGLLGGSPPKYSSQEEENK